MATTGLFSCGQVGKSKTGTADLKTINPARNYEYDDYLGKHLIVQKAGAKGETYTDPNGKKYFKTIF